MSKNFNKLPQIFPTEKQYFSYTYEIGSASLMERFVGSEGFKGERFYWQNPEKTLEMLGLGAVITVHAADERSLATCRRQFFQQWSRLDTTLFEPAFCGAFPFARSEETTVWKELNNGYFILPELLLRRVDGQTWVTVTVAAKNQKELLEKLTTVQQKIPDPEPITFVSATGDYQESAVPAYLSTVSAAIEDIKNQATSLEKVVIFREMSVAKEAVDLPQIVARLEKQQPNTYLFVLEGATRAFVGATPERLLAATATTFKTASVAGTISRGKTLAEDHFLGEQLLADKKNREEHQLVVARIKRELQPFVKEKLVSGEPQLLKNRDVQHLFLPLEGTRVPGISFLEVIGQLHPTPALGGEPKAEALRWLAAHGQMNRGLYGAPIGWISVGEDVGEFAVGIRSGVFGRQKGWLFAGSGIVRDSVPAEELIETRVKFQPMIRGVIGDESSNES